MTLPQTLSFGILGVMMVMFAWGRLRYDLVAVAGLLVAILAGIVPYDKAFTGFGDDIVIIVGSALVVSAAIARSGIIERLVRPLAPYLTSSTMQVIVLTTTVTAMSALVKNIGALAMMMPVAFQLARRNEKPVSAVLMPMAFGSLLGGTITLVGTSPNVIVSRVREQLTGQPFGMFDFTPVGLGLALGGLVFLAFGFRLLPQGRKGQSSIDAAFKIEGYTTEVVVQEKSKLIGKPISDLHKLSSDEVDVLMIIRDGRRRHWPPADYELAAGDVMLLEGEPGALETAVNEAGFKLARDQKDAPTDTPRDDIGLIEAVISDGSFLVDRSPAQLRLHDRFHVTLLAVARRGERITRQMRSVKLRTGDVLVLQGDVNTLPDALGEMGCLPLATRNLQLGSGRHSLLPVGVLVIAMALMAMHVVPVAVAFFGAAVVMLLIGALPLKEAYTSIEWPILVLLGAMIPISDSLRTTGSADLVAGWLARVGEQLPAYGSLGLVMAAAMAVTPFLNNAATMLVMGPIAAGFAQRLGYGPDAFLMAVAIGAACDFLTPIGHQCNTLVMGPGGYRFGDYWRLGLPLTIMVLLIGVPLIAFFWPFKPI